MQKILIKRTLGSLQEKYDYIRIFILTIRRCDGAKIYEDSYPCSERYSDKEQKALRVMQINTAKIMQWNLAYEQYNEI